MIKLKKRKLFYSLLLLIVLFSTNIYSQQCQSCNKRVKFKFKLLKEKGLSVDTLKVKTTGVYISNTNEIDIDGKQITMYYFYRFFDNGKIYISCGYCSFPSQEKLNDLKYGSYGEYRIEGDEIIRETYAPYPGYYLSYYKIEGNKILLTHTSKRKFKGRVKLEYAPYVEYNFYKCNLNSQPFW